jgi:hypothetical protein
MAMTVFIRSHGPIAISGAVATVSTATNKAVGSTFSVLI